MERSAAHTRRKHSNAGEAPVAVPVLGTALLLIVKIFAPADCIVSNTAADNDHALRQIKTVLKGDIAVSTRLRFHSRRP